MAATQCRSLCGAPLQQRAAPRVSRRAAMQPATAFFGRKSAGAAVAEPPAAAPARKQGFFTIRQRPADEPAAAKPAKKQPAKKQVAKQQPAKQQKAAASSKTIDKAAEYE